MHAVWSAMLDGKTLVVDEEALDVMVPGDKKRYNNLGYVLMDDENTRIRS
jgi:hypothetical protein